MATLALNAAEWFRRGRLLIFCAPENTGSILAHRSSCSTYRRVQFCATTSVAPSTVRVLDGLRKQRNLSDYDGETITHAALQECLAQAQALRALATETLK
jgi:hypothetical protein